MIYDISMELHPSMQTYNRNTENQPIFRTNVSHETHEVHDTSVTLNLHTGTHIDYPLHMIKDGATSDTEQLSRFLTDVKVFDLTTCTDSITKEDLIPLDIQPGDFILFKTKNSFTETFEFDFVYLDESGSEYLVEKNIDGVGTDALGIERSQKGHPTHKNLLSSNIIIMEGLRLKDVPEGIYHMIFLPLKIYGVEAGLGRAILQTK